jgi:hypothetical protein
MPKRRIPHWRKADENEKADGGIDPKFSFFFRFLPYLKSGFRQIIQYIQQKRKKSFFWAE